MSIRQMSIVWECDCSGQDQALLLALADFADDAGNQVYPSVRRLIWKTGQSERSVQRRLARFRQLGVLRVLRTGGGGHNSPTHYALCLDVLPKKPAFVW